MIIFYVIFILFLGVKSFFIYTPLGYQVIIPCNNSDLEYPLWRFAYDYPIINTQVSSPFIVIELNERIKYKDNKDLIIKNVSKNDIGTYQCIKNDKYLYRELTISKDYEVYEGASIKLKCDKDLDLIEWRDTNNLVIKSRFEVNENNLIIKNIKKSDEGEYKCLYNDIIYSRYLVKVKVISYNIVFIVAIIIGFGFLLMFLVYLFNVKNIKNKYGKIIKENL